MSSIYYSYVNRKVEAKHHQRPLSNPTRKRNAYNHNYRHSVNFQTGKRNEGISKTLNEKNYYTRVSSPPDRTNQYFVRSRTPNLEFYTHRQFIAGNSLRLELAFSLLLVLTLFFLGFVLGYNFSDTQSTLYDDFLESGYNNVVTNTDSKTITTLSNATVTNTNNDKDTITNMVSSG